MSIRSRFFVSVQFKKLPIEVVISNERRKWNQLKQKSVPAQKKIEPRVERPDLNSSWVWPASESRLANIWLREDGTDQGSSFLPSPQESHHKGKNNKKSQAPREGLEYTTSCLSGKRFTSLLWKIEIKQI